MHRLLTKLMVVAATLMWINAAGADGHSKPGKGQVYVSPGMAVYSGPDDKKIGYDGEELGPALILGYGLTDNWAVEILGSRIEADFDNRNGKGEDDVTLMWLDFLYKLPAKNNWQPFVLMGGGRSDYEFERVQSDKDDTQLNVGLGVLRHLDDNLAFRADLRAVTSDEAGSLEPFAFIGLTGFIGAGSTPRAPADSDGDGVPNSIDKCPTTPPGRVVDADGCEFDSDGDGVVDGDDQCPGTPAGVTVDSKGCPLDSDGDGVPDYLDECPDTEPGAKVDAKGCYIELEEEVTIDMNIEFGTDKAEIRDDHVAELNRAVNFLRQYPTTNAVIEGHTDTDGAAAYNQGLSERRAKAVYDYLINEAGIDAERLSWTGFGETQPIADNSTSEGKQRNRRVSAVVAGTHTVRQ